MQPRKQQQRRGRGWGCHMLAGIAFESRLKTCQLPDMPESPPPVQPRLLAAWPYDFALEQRALRQAAEAEAAAAEAETERKRQEKARQELLEQQQKQRQREQDEKAKAKEEAAATAQTATRRNGYVNSAAAPATTFQLSKDPLKPQPAAAAADKKAATGATATSSAAACAPPLSGQSLKDFERVEDPFDEAEIGTIDVMAELKNVLGGGGAGTTTVAAAAAAAAAGKISEESSSGGGHMPSVHEICFPKLSLGPAESGLSSPPPTPSPPLSSSESPALKLPAPPSPPMPTVPPPPPPPPHLAPLSASPPSLSRGAWGGIGSGSSGAVPAGSVGGVRSSSYPELAASSSSRSTRPQPTPPPALPPHPPSLPPKQPVAVASGPVPVLSDPYPGLGPLERTKVDSLRAMGFPRDRAARAVARLGLSDDDLLVFLCAVDRVAERSGASHQEAEVAIPMLGSPVKAEQYLKLKMELLQFGFSAEDIKEAALATSLDRDKTIALLLANMK